MWKMVKKTSKTSTLLRWLYKERYSNAIKELNDSFAWEDEDRQTNQQHFVIVKSMLKYKV